jgi:RNA polymerase sigma-70 factor (ECF subfamily)
VSSELCARVVSALPPGCIAEDIPALERVLSNLLDSARDVVPDAKVDAWEFIAFVLARLPDGSVVEQVLPTLRTTDLYVVFACLVGDPVAVQHVEAECIRPLQARLRRLRLTEADVSDTLQDAREELLVGDPGRPALLARYGGRGDLRSWVRVVVMRNAVRARKGAREIPADDLAQIVAESVIDLDALAISAQVRAMFREAFGSAILTLESRERNVLRLNLVEGVSIDRLAQIYNVHRATAARWVERARAKLETATLERLKASGVAEGESSLRLVWSQLDASVERLLALEDAIGGSTLGKA